MNATYRHDRCAGGAVADESTSFQAIQTDAPINPGNSVGAAVNMIGRLIGVNSAIAALGNDVTNMDGTSIGLGFAIPVDQAKRVTDQLIATGVATHATPGAQVTNDPTVRGARVVAVTRGGPAAAAGPSTGVVVTQMNDQVIVDSNALVAAVRWKAPGDSIILQYFDPSGATHTAHVKLGSDQEQ